MSVLQVLQYSGQRLRKVAKPVEEVNAEIQRIVVICSKRCTRKKVSVWPQLAGRYTSGSS